MTLLEKRTMSSHITAGWMESKQKADRDTDITYPVVTIHHSLYTFATARLQLLDLVLWKDEGMFNTGSSQEASSLALP